MNVYSEHGEPLFLNIWHYLFFSSGSGMFKSYWRTHGFPIHTRVAKIVILFKDFVNQSLKMDQIINKLVR